MENGKLNLKMSALQHESLLIQLYGRQITHPTLAGELGLGILFRNAQFLSRVDSTRQSLSQSTVAFQYN